MLLFSVLDSSPKPQGNYLWGLIEVRFHSVKKRINNSSFKLILNRWHEKQQLRSKGASTGDWLEHHLLRIRPTQLTINLMCWKSARVPSYSRTNQHVFQASRQLSIPTFKIFTGNIEDTLKFENVKSKVSNGKKNDREILSWMQESFSNKIKT